MTSGDTPATIATRRRPGNWPLTATLIAASLGFAVIQLDVTVVNVAVKQIGASFGGGITGLQWVVSSYTLVFAALILTAGSLGDRFGAKRVLCTGFVVFVTASVVCGLSVSMGMLIAARAVQGLGAALLGSCSLALLPSCSSAWPWSDSRRVGGGGRPVIGRLASSARGPWQLGGAGARLVAMRTDSRWARSWRAW